MTRMVPAVRHVALSLIRRNTELDRQCLVSASPQIMRLRTLATKLEKKKGGDFGQCG